MTLLRGTQLGMNPSGVTPHLVPSIRRSTALPNWKLFLNSGHDVYVRFVDEVMALIFDGVQRITVLGNLSLRPPEKSPVVKPGDFRSTFGGIKESAIDRNRLLQDGNAPQSGHEKHGQHRACFEQAQARSIVGGKLIFRGAYRVE